MAGAIPVEAYHSGLLTILEEVFETSHGYLLDPETSLFGTLASVSAEEASRPVHAHGATLAAQVNHLRFNIDVMTEGARTGEQRPADCAASWRVGAVTEDEWRELVERLRVAYGQVRAFAGSFEGWDARFVGGAFALVGHCAYHLGESGKGWACCAGRLDGQAHTGRVSGEHFAALLGTVAV